MILPATLLALLEEILPENIVGCLRFYRQRFLSHHVEESLARVCIFLHQLLWLFVACSAPDVDFFHDVFFYSLVFHEWHVIELQLLLVFVLTVLEPFGKKFQVGLESVLVCILFQEIFTMVLLCEHVDA